MQHGASQRHLVLSVVMAATIAACGSAGTGSRLGERAAAPTGPTTAPAAAGAGATPPVAPNPSTAASQAAARLPSARPGSISTTEAASLLNQVDDLLRQVDGELAADDADATNQGE